MSKGPRLNNISKNFTSRDSLGIEGVQTTIQSEICPIVNTVTPRPFYWAFITWCFYDFYNNVAAKNRNDQDVYKYVKKQNFFFALSNILNNRIVTEGFTGTDNIKNKINLEFNEFKYDETYLKGTLSTMAYYTAGLYTMNLVLEKDPYTDEQYKYPKLSKEGESLALAFEEVIKNTNFYKNRFEFNFGKSDLIELGQIVNINLNGFGGAKTILINNLFHKKANQELIDSQKYVKYISETFNIKEFNLKKYREILFDYFSPKGEYQKGYSGDLKEIVNNWEIVIGRQYFITGLEMIWKFMLENLSTFKTCPNWFRDVFTESEFSFNINDKLETVINECNYKFDEREDMIAKAKSKNDSGINSVENGLRVTLSIYNRFNNRDDLSNNSKRYFDYGIESNSVSLNQFFEKINEYKTRSVKEFLEYIMFYYLLNQHLNTAFEKMMQNRDGYYIEKIENEYIRKADFSFDFQGIRLIQLFSVMKDLDVLEVEKYV